MEKKSYKGMRWFFVIIHLYLYLTAILGLLIGIGELTGMIYLDMAETFYALFPMLQVVNIFFGVMQIILAAVAIYVRRQLANYRAIGPRLLLLYQGFMLLYYIAYIAGTSLVLGVLALEWTSGALILGQLLLIVVNKIYFAKRMNHFLY